MCIAHKLCTKSEKHYILHFHLNTDTHFCNLDNAIIKSMDIRCPFIKNGWFHSTLVLQKITRHEPDQLLLAVHVLVLVVKLCLLQKLINNHCHYWIEGTENIHTLKRTELNIRPFIL